MISRSRLEARLTSAEWHVAQGRKSVLLQREIVADTTRSHRDSAAAVRLLADLEAALALFIASRNQLETELQGICAEGTL